jgi:branched-chain amino acid transport system substrate-binding protein
MAAVVAGLAAVTMVAAACGSSTPTDQSSGSQSSGSSAASSAGSESSAASTDPIKFGVSLPLTGGQSIPGIGHQKGYEFCIKELNATGGLLGRQTELIVKDSQSNVQNGVNQVQQLISSDKVDFMLGTFSTGSAFPQETITEQHKMVVVQPSDSSEQSHSRGYKYLFGQTPKPVDYLGQTAIDSLKAFAESGDIKPGDMPKTAAVVYQDNFFTQSVQRGILGGKLEVPGTDITVDFGKGYLAEAGIDVVYKNSFPSDFNDWNSLAASIKASNADYLMVLTMPPLEVNIAKALATVQYKPKGVFFTQGTYPQFQESLGAAADGIILWTSWDPALTWAGTFNGKDYTNADFIKSFTETMGEAPDEDAAQAFASCETLTNGAVATNSLDHTKIRDWIAARTAADPSKTIMGPYHFDEKGLTADRDVVLQQWQGGKLVNIYPADKELIPNLAKVQWPMPNW